MKRFLWGIAGLCLGIVLLVAGIIGAIRLYRNAETPPESSREESQIMRDAGFVIGVWENKLAVFHAGSAEPMQIYDVYIASLPEEEQERLRAGVVAENAAALASFLEDYTS